MSWRHSCARLGCAVAGAAFVLVCGTCGPERPYIPYPPIGASPPIVHVGAARLADGSPCSASEPCYVPAGTEFEIPVQIDIPASIPLSGYRWEVRWPRESWRPEPCDPERWLPAGPPGRTGIGEASSCAGPPRPDSCYAPDNADHDGTWTLGSNSITIRYRATAGGQLEFRFFARDTARHVSTDSSISYFELVRPPETAIERMAACDCPHPPSACGAVDSVRVGWVTGDANGEWPTERWQRFCENDTVPAGVHVRFFARGRRDASSAPCEHGVPLQYAYFYAWARLTQTNASMPLSQAVPERPFPHPGPAWTGGSVGWEEICASRYTFFAASVDPAVRADTTPDSMPFFGGFPPQMDSVRVPSVIVLVPACPPNRPFQCPMLNVPFGPDTVAVYGVWRRDIIEPPVTPLAIGYNDFLIPVRAWAHDHPADIAADATPERRHSLVRSWWYELDCAEVGCTDRHWLGESTWIDENVLSPPPAQTERVFDELPVFQLPLDTLVVSDGTSTRLFATVGPFAQGVFRLRVRARDTGTGSTIAEPASLDPPVESNAIRDAKEWGRTSGFREQTFVIRELGAVRPRPAPVPRR